MDEKNAMMNSQGEARNPMQTRRLRQKFRNGRRWEFREFDVPLDEEITKLSERLHAARQPYQESIQEWQVRYKPSKPLDYTFKEVDPFDRTVKAIRDEHTTIPSSFEIRIGQWLKHYWRITLSWIDGDDKPPFWHRDEKDLVPVPEASQKELFDTDEDSNPEFLPPPPLLIEGTEYEIETSRYERNHEARRLCILHYGARCFVCGFDFGTVYGAAAAGFIHVHHLIPISEIGVRYVVNPIEDLRPLCPNCHSVAHLRTPPYSITEIKMFISNQNPDNRS